MWKRLRGRLDLLGAALAVCALISFAALKLIGYFSWCLPIFGTLLPLLAAPYFWGLSLILALLSMVACVQCRRRSVLTVLLVVVDGALLAFYLTLIFSFVFHSAWGDRFQNEVFGWIYQLPEDVHWPPG